MEQILSKDYLDIKEYREVLKSKEKRTEMEEKMLKALDEKLKVFDENKIVEK